MNRKRRSFSKEFNREAVALVTEHGYSYADAGRSLDVEAKLVGRWRRELEAAHELIRGERHGLVSIPFLRKRQTNDGVAQQSLI